ncbi:glycine oxidase [Eucalyptus grandis]|uniref:glycine oxidase n=1 Tax=Eucalyptus grandis TaxID=71139 RepID=UPI00192ED215|nr:glycine oxidase [Eucalyptus grandis]
MAAISTYRPAAKPRLKPSSSVVSRRPSPCALALRSSLLGSRIPVNLSAAWTPLNGPPGRVRVGWRPVVASQHSFDIVIVGAGIIGLTIARQLLLESDLSVAVVDKVVPCSGATGAGQGFIWMASKTPGSDIWELALRSHQLWESLAENLHNQGLNPQEVLGWKKTGSLLFGKTVEESALLERRVEQLSEAGVEAKFLSSHELLLEEPALFVDKESGAALLPNDCQLDAHRTVAYIEEGNRQFVSQGRYAEFYNDPVISLLRSGKNGEVEAVLTSKSTFYCKKAVVVAAGCWTGSLMRELDIGVHVPIKPRKGHLLVLENFDQIRLNHGLMEVGYVSHQQIKQHSAAGLCNDEEMLSISMTATTDTMGNLVLGSSRQFVGFSTEADASIIDSIWKRVQEFFPKLREMNLVEIGKDRKVRIGLRPYMPDGKPVIGTVPGLSNVFLASGHEGSGLSLALGTAEMVADMVMGNQGKVDFAPFAVEGRVADG